MVDQVCWFSRPPENWLFRLKQSAQNILIKELKGIVYLLLFFPITSGNSLLLAMEVNLPGFMHIV